MARKKKDKKLKKIKRMAILLLILIIIFIVLSLITPTEEELGNGLTAEGTIAGLELPARSRESR